MKYGNIESEMENNHQQTCSIPGIEELDPTAKRIVELAQSTSKGITDKDISSKLPELRPSEKAQAINKLLSQGYFDLFKLNENLIYKLKDQTKAKIAKGADSEEKVVYTIIEEAGNKGIWIRDIRFKSNINATQLNKILKSLETKKFIKAVKSVAQSKKKVYMLHNLEPDTSVTGGAWYQDQDFEAEFVDVLNQQCYRFLEQKRSSNQEYSGPLVEKNSTFASLPQVWKFISDLGISKVMLSEKDLEVILNTLIYDGKVEKVLSHDQTNLYRSVKSLINSPGLAMSTCGVCPIRKNCCDFGDVTPMKCRYLTEWLDT